MVFPPTNPEQCLSYIQDRLTDNEIKITCLMIEAYAVRIQHEGFTAGVKTMHATLNTGCCDTGEE